ncbi:MAG: basic amino acid/polyamine antiporter, family [Frankiales bacterium]|nr:basic amino acid/polyamine antiporter, family [Frankiales bacterium]
MSFFFSLSTLAELVNIGTLFAFVVVAAGVVVLRRTRPDLQRSFRTPWVPWVPVASIFVSFWLMLNLPTATWIRFGVWLAAGLVVCSAYGYRHSGLNGATDEPYPASAAAGTARSDRPTAPRGSGTA